jgi:hypothetical protein
MAATKVPTPTRDERVAHYVEGGLNRRDGEIHDKETVDFSYRTEWRGQPVRVDLQADRYRHSSGWSDWRVYATNSLYVDADGQNMTFTAGEVTPTAHARLSDACKPDVYAWLASDAYPASRRSAFSVMVENAIREMRPYMSDLGRERKLLDAARPELDEADFDRLGRALDAYEEFAGILREERA